MAIQFSFLSLLLLFGIFSDVYSQIAIKEYVIKKDVFSGLKASEYSIYDQSEKQLLYRIESKISVLQNIKVIAYPSKQEVANLKAKFKVLGYKAEISILNPITNQWPKGTVREKIQLVGNFLNIEWNGEKLTLETKVGSLTSKFYNANKQLLAQFRITTYIGKKEFVLDTYSNKYPDEIYFLGLAAEDSISSSKNKG